MTTTDSTGAAPAEPRQPGFGGRLVRSINRIIGVFMSPAATFRDIGKAPDWVVPLVLAILISVGLNQMVQGHIDVTGSIQHRMEQSGLSGAQLEQAMTRQTQFWEKYGQAVFIGGSVVGYPLLLLVLALIFWGGTNAFGGRITFGKTFSVWVYGWWPKVVEGGLVSAVLMGKESVRADLINRVLLTNPAAWMPESASDTPLYALAAGLNLFTLYTMYLVAIGLSESGKLSRVGAFGLVGLLYGIWVALGVGWAAI